MLEVRGDLHVAAAPSGAADGTAPADLDGLLLRLALPRAARAPAVIRHTLGGLAVAVAMEAGALADLRLAVSEVATALVEGAPDGGALELEAGLAGGGLRLVLRAPARPEAAGTVPLTLLVALTEAVELHELPAGVVEVVMTFPLRRP